ncbi:MAG: hypothetical protein AAFU79_28565, partial [Myxococcota bacterium]
QPVAKAPAKKAPAKKKSATKKVAAEKAPAKAVERSCDLVDPGTPVKVAELKPGMKLRTRRGDFEVEGVEGRKVRWRLKGEEFSGTGSSLLKSWRGAWALKPLDKKAKAAPGWSLAIKTREPGQAVMMVDLDRFDRALARDKDFYVKPGGGGAEIEGRLPQAREALAEWRNGGGRRLGEAFQGTLVNSGGGRRPHIVDGRHRFAAMTEAARREGLSKVPVVVDKREVSFFREEFGGEVIEREAGFPAIGSDSAKAAPKKKAPAKKAPEKEVEGAHQKAWNRLIGSSPQAIQKLWGDPGRWGPEMAKTIEPLARYFNAFDGRAVREHPELFRGLALRKLPERLEVHRGLAVPEDAVPDILDGGEMELGAFTSWSTERTVAQRYASSSERNMVNRALSGGKTRPKTARIILKTSTDTGLDARSLPSMNKEIGLTGKVRFKSVERKQTDSGLLIEIEAEHIVSSGKAKTSARLAEPQVAARKVAAKKATVVPARKAAKKPVVDPAAAYRAALLDARAAHKALEEIAGRRPVTEETRG